MMKFGTPEADDGPGSVSMKVGLERVGEPSEFRSGVSFWRESPSSRVAFLFTREAIRLTRSRGCLTRWPLPVRSWGAPPVERGACSGFSAGVVSVAVVSVVEVSGAAGSAAVVSAGAGAAACGSAGCGAGAA